MGITIHGDSFGQELDEFIEEELNIQRVHNSKAVLKNLISGRVDYILWGYYPVVTNAVKIGVLDKLKIHAKPIAAENMYMAFSKKSPYKKYIPEANKIIKRLRGDGTIAKLAKKYLKLYQSQHNAE